MRIFGQIDTVIPRCRGTQGEVLGLIGVRFSHLSSIVSQKLEAYDLMIQTDLARHRSVRVPVSIPVEVRGMEVFSQLTIKDLSMTRRN